VVANREEVVGWNEEKKLKTVITYDDGTSLRNDELIGRFELETYEATCKEIERG
jgi:hypothetical protein